MMLLAALACAALVQEGKVTLQHRPQAGDATVSTTRIAMRVDVTVTAGEETRKLTTELRESRKQREEILAVDGGRIAKASYHRIEDVQEQRPPGAAEFVRVEKPLHGRQVLATRNGDQVALEGAEVAEPAAREFDLEDAFARGFPEHPVGVGDSWDVPGEVLRDMFGDAESYGTLSLEVSKIGDHQGRCSVFLDARLRLQRKMTGMMDLAIDAQGTVVVWVERGYVLELKLEGLVTIAAKNAAMELAGKGPATISVVSTFE